jgi:hypothetical protein
MSIKTILIIAAVVAVIGVVLFKAFQFVAFSSAAKAQAEKMAVFVPDPANHIAVSVRGWNNAEIKKILSDDFSAYDLSPDSTVVVTAKPDGTFVLTFPNDIEPRLLYFLVNYIQYPRDFDLKHRSIGVLGRVVITPAFGAPDPKFVGEQAQIFVPADDSEYDLVYAKLETGEVYSISFTDLIWRRVESARMPHTVGGL